MCTFGPKSGVPPVGPPVVAVGVGDGVPPPGSVHNWFAVPAQLQICSRVPSADDGPVASRHLPDPVLTSSPLLAVHFWALVPLQVYSCTLVPLAVPAPVTSMHLPSAWMLLSALPTVHCCALVPLQVQS